MKNANDLQWLVSYLLPTTSWSTCHSDEEDASIPSSLHYTINEVSLSASLSLIGMVALVNCHHQLVSPRATPKRSKAQCVLLLRISYWDMAVEWLKCSIWPESLLLFLKFFPSPRSWTIKKSLIKAILEVRFFSCLLNWMYTESSILWLASSFHQTLSHVASIR